MNTHFLYEKFQNAIINLSDQQRAIASNPNYDVNYLLKDAYLKYTDYCAQTRSWSGKILAILPFTAVNKNRTACRRALNKAIVRLEAVKNMRISGHEAQAAVKDAIIISDDDEYYVSPLLQPRKQQKNKKKTSEESPPGKRFTH